MLVRTPGHSGQEHGTPYPRPMMVVSLMGGNSLSR
jgi:hypothetical protein